MLIAHVYKDVYPPVAGGIEKHIHAVRTSGAGAEHEVVVCARSRRSSVVETPWGLERHVGEYGRVLSAPLAPAMGRALRASRADLFHLHMPNPTGELAVLTVRDRPYVATYHADIARQAFALPLYRPLIRRVLRGAACVIVASEGLRRNSPQVAGVEALKVVPYGVDTEALDPSRVPTAAIARLRDRYGHPFVLAVGRLVYYKGFDVLVEACERGLTYPVVIVGEGPMHEQLASRIQARGLGTRITLAGHLDEGDLHAHYAAASAFVLPSTSPAEAFGIATAEAQAFGLPAVVTSLGTGTTEAIRPGASGLVVPPNDPDALAGALRRLLDTDVRAEMSAEARSFAEQHLSLTAMAATLAGVYERAMSRDS